MKKVSSRAMTALILAGVLVLGMLGFFIQYLVQGGDWVVFPGSPHVYTGGNLNSGVVTDRAGVVLLDSTDGRVYAQDEAVRRSMLHILGDREGFIAAPLLSNYADVLVGYDFFSGAYSISGKASTARLSLSSRVQTTALAALAGRPGAVGVYNYRTGALLCAVSSPSYDPNNVPDIAGDTTGAYQGVYVNRFFNASFVPGSIFKLVTAAAALERIPDIAQRTFQCDGACTVEGDTVNCNGVHGTVDFQTALAKSCNVAFGQIAIELGPKVLTEYAEKLGITSRFQVDGYETTAGHFDLTDSPDAEVAWAGIGQYTDLVNPLGYLRLMGVIAGGGRAAEPYLMEQIEGKKLTASYRVSPKQTEQLLEAGVCARLAEMMHNNVVSVYGAGNFPDLYVCAKSGTAEVGGGLKPHATFAGFIQDPDYPLAFLVVVENAGSGSDVCAGIAGTVLRECVSVMDNE